MDECKPLPSSIMVSKCLFVNGLSHMTGTYAMLQWFIRGALGVYHGRISDVFRDRGVLGMH